MSEYIMARDPGYRDAMEEVAQALASVTRHLLPRDCPHGPWGECEDDCTWGESWPRPDFFIDQWAIALSTECMTPDGPPGELGVAAPAHLRTHVVRGLLDTASDHVRDSY